MKNRVEFGEYVAVRGSPEEMGGWERKVPMSGRRRGGLLSFEMVCHWDETGETGNVVELEVVDEEGVDDDDDDASVAADASPVSEVAPSPFVQDWQGRGAEFMRSNQHRSREVDRRWNTEGLEGLVLRLVEGDKSARNWWRKVWSGCVCVFDHQ